MGSSMTGIREVLSSAQSVAPGSVSLLIYSHGFICIRCAPRRRSTESAVRRFLCM